MTFATTFKSEVTRLARREVKTAIDSLRSAVVQYRHDIAKLKRLVDEQRREIAFLKGQEVKRNGTARAAAPETALDGDVRFSSKSVRSQRKRLGLSAEELGKLVGVTAQTVYNWEKGVARPREQQLAAFVAMRAMGRREAKRRLEQAR